ncbi:hypothetical protein ABTM64_20450, partial [Acinetobacter baumannii]
MHARNAWISVSPARLAASALALAAGIASAAPAFAGEGYMQNGIGARSKALAGAGVADSTDATAASLNPAGLTGVSTQIDTST